MSEPTYIVGNWETGGAMLQCQREECKVPGNCPSGSCWWTEDIPWPGTIEQVINSYQRHIATHEKVKGP